MNISHVANKNLNHLTGKQYQRNVFASEFFSHLVFYGAPFGTDPRNYEIRLLLTISNRWRNSLFWERLFDLVSLKWTDI